MPRVVFGKGTKSGAQDENERAAEERNASADGNRYWDTNEIAQPPSRISIKEYGHDVFYVHKQCWIGHQGGNISIAVPCSCILGDIKAQEATQT